MSASRNPVSSATRNSGSRTCVHIRENFVQIGIVKGVSGSRVEIELVGFGERIFRDTGGIPQAREQLLQICDVNIDGAIRKLRIVLVGRRLDEPATRLKLLHVIFGVIRIDGV